MVVYTSASAFAEAIDAPGTDDYAGVTPGVATPSPLFRMAGPHAYSGRTSASTFFGAGTAADPWLSTNNAEDAMIFDVFPSTVVAVGAQVFSSDLQGVFQPGDVTLTITDGDAALVRTVSASSSSEFFGIVSDNPPITFVVSAVQPAVGFIWPTIASLTLGRRPVTDRLFRNGFE